MRQPRRRHVGRTLDTLYEAGVTALYSLIAATAATRLGLRPTFTHLDSTRDEGCYVGEIHVDTATK